MLRRRRVLRWLVCWFVTSRNVVGVFFMAFRISWSRTFVVPLDSGFFFDGRNSDRFRATLAQLRARGNTICTCIYLHAVNAFRQNIKEADQTEPSKSWHVLVQQPKWLWPRTGVATISLIHHCHRGWLHSRAKSYSIGKNKPPHRGNLHKRYAKDHILYHHKIQKQRCKRSAFSRHLTYA